MRGANENHPFATTVYAYTRSRETGVAPAGSGAAGSPPWTRLGTRAVPSTQNQAFNALLFFYRHGLKHELGTINSLRAKRPPALRHCPAREDEIT
jgi:hypothetical protein